MSLVERFVEVDRLEPDERVWQALCASAERLVDTDPAHYEVGWLPTVQARLARWPSGLRCCPDRWFRTPRPRADLLLRLGGTGPADFAGRAPLRDDHSPDAAQSVSAVTAPGRWTVFTGDAVEFDLAGNDAGPDPVDLQVAAFVLRNWTEFKDAALRILADLAVDRGPMDLYLEREVPPGRRRFEVSDLVSVASGTPAFQVHCDDEGHVTNGWPYGCWRVDFAWGRLVDVRVGTYGDNYSVLRAPLRDHVH